jgi:tryptophanyl-tRNA synthetase
MTTARKTLVSGIQSSGKLHIGNYFGAIKQNIELGNSDAYDAYIFLADYHSMTSLIDAGERRNNTFDAACTYLAFGLDPEKVTLFKQSDVPEVHELTWILNTVAPMPMLMLAHAFKDHDAKNKDVSVGLFDYPVLMASDILIYDGEIVPVGKDQEQHVEIARELAGKYNRAYGELLKMPQAFIKKDVATVPGIDGEKMSKSKNNHIPLFGSPEDVQKRIMSIVTDSARPEDKKDPDTNNVYNIHKLFLTKEEDEVLRAKFKDGGYGYKEAKEALLKTYTNWLRSFEDKYQHYHSNPDEVYEILRKGGEKARRKAQEKMKQVRIATGLDKLN